MLIGSTKLKRTEVHIRVYVYKFKDMYIMT